MDTQTNGPGGAAHGAGSPRIVIIGGGFGGLCMAIRLKQAGIDSFTLIEKAGDIGGTWRDNTYPGACCDTKAFAYCYSFEQKTDWSRKWVPWSEILGYMHQCVARHGLEKHCRLGTEITEAVYDDARNVWNLLTSTGESITTDVVVTATGQLNRPSVPRIQGQDCFEGTAFHSARWDHDAELAGKRVGVIGNAASAIQFIPEIARDAARVEIFQRSANWMIRRGNRPYSKLAHRILGSSQWLSRLYRSWIWAYYEFFIYPIILGWPGFRHAGEWLARRAIRRDVADPGLRARLVPDYPIGGKRILVSDDYYPSLNRPNVTVCFEPIERISPSGVVTIDGAEHALDAIIYGTGFRSTEFLAPMEIRGRDGRSLAKQWRSAGPEAYLGITVPGFPNLFMMYGPNTNLGHYSIIFMLERQAHYILECLKLKARRGSARMEVRADVCRRFNDRLQKQLAKTAWARVDHSWYMDKGRITNNWSRSTSAYWWQTRRVRESDFEFAPASDSENLQPGLAAR
jgi:cation diffusion facilitator CzcD-associated flavoprotein CzcO